MRAAVTTFNANNLFSFGNRSGRAYNSCDDQEGEDEAGHESIYDFHDVLKAKSLHLRTPLQIVLLATYDPSKKIQKRRSKTTKPRSNMAINLVE